jgi:hypothetical protein
VFFADCQCFALTISSNYNTIKAFNIACLAAIAVGKSACQPPARLLEAAVTGGCLAYLVLLLRAKPPFAKIRIGATSCFYFARERRWLCAKIG